MVLYESTATRSAIWIGACGDAGKTSSRRKGCREPDAQEGVPVVALLISKPLQGFEPWTYALRKHRSAAELKWPTPAAGPAGGMLGAIRRGFQSARANAGATPAPLALSGFAHYRSARPGSAVSVGSARMVAIAQLVRAQGCDPWGRGFESRWPPFLYPDSAACRPVPFPRTVLPWPVPLDTRRRHRLSRHSTIVTSMVLVFGVPVAPRARISRISSCVSPAIRAWKRQVTVCPDVLAASSGWPSGARYTES